MSFNRTRKGPTHISSLCMCPGYRKGGGSSPSPGPLPQVLTTKRDIHTMGDSTPPSVVSVRQKLLNKSRWVF